MRFLSCNSLFPLIRSRPGPLLYMQLDTGNWERQALPFRPIPVRFPVAGKPDDGIYRSRFEVHRLWRGFHFYRRRADFLSRQTVQERPKALQAVQGEACSRINSCSHGDPNHLCGVRNRDYRPLQADTGQACALPYLLSKAAGIGTRVSIGLDRLRENLNSGLF